MLLEKESTRKSIASHIGSIYHMGALKRSVVIWIGFQVALWLIFGISYIINREAWINVTEVDSASAAVGGWWTTLLFIIVNNFIICMLITAGNLFVRFNVITPGLLILALQAVMIGWMAGSNGFEVPFTSVAAANIQYIKIGLWETTAYALACAVSLPKSLLIAETFPAKEWALKRKLREVKLSAAETVVVLLGGLALVGAAIIETFAILG